MNFKNKYKEYLDLINSKIEKCFEIRDCEHKKIYEAMRYSLLAGGKRLRPILALAVCDLFLKDKENIIPYACAIEMIHTYSLIHDDLPAMDNDDLRRGRPTCHIVFGEALAILAGDGLLNYAYQTMLSDAFKNYENLEYKIRAMHFISEASGVEGMIAGQVIDMESQNRKIDPELLENMHRCKTGALIKASVMASAYLCNATNDEIVALEKYAENIGLAFQIKDDILDVDGSDEELGKKVGSDMANEKSTFVSLYGIDRSKQILNDLTNQAISSLNIFGEKAEFLKELAFYLISRKN